MKKTYAILVFLSAALLLAGAARPLQAQPKKDGKPQQTQAAAADKLARRAVKKAAREAARKRKELIRKNHFCIHCGRLLEKPGQKCPQTRGKTLCTLNCPDCGKNLRDKGNLNKQGVHHCKFKTRVTPAKPIPPVKNPVRKPRAKYPKKK